MEQISYLTYKFTLREWIKYLFIFEIIASFFSYFFYHSLIPFLISQVFITKYYSYVCTHLNKQRNKRILTEFSDFIVSISASLYTGYSIENSVIEAKETIINMYGKHSIIYNEILVMERMLSLNIPIEKIFDSLSKRTCIEEILCFCEILNIVKKTGGDLISIIKSTSITIKQKSELLNEIDTAVSGKRFEQYIMLCMPFIIFIYIELTQPGFFLPLYHNTLGIFVSTTCLIIYCCSFFFSRKILSIEV